MSWTYEYDVDLDKTIIYWDGGKQGEVDGKITDFKHGLPTGPARDVILDAIQSSGTPERIKMQYNLNYGLDADHS